MNKSFASKTKKNAVIRFMILEAVAIVLMALVLVYLFVFDNGLTSEEAVFRLLVAGALFVIYVGYLFITILMPVLGREQDAR